MQTAHELHRMSIERWLGLPADVRLLMAASLFLGWDYTTSRPSVPFLPHAEYPRSVVNPAARATNCSTFTAAVVMATYPTAAWTDRSYAQLQVFAGMRFDSPVLAVVEAGVGNAVDALQPGRWHLVQGWRKLSPPRGHAVLVQRGQDDALDILHASSRLGAVVIESDTVSGLERRFPAGYFAACLGV